MVGPVCELLNVHCYCECVCDRYVCLMGEAMYYIYDVPTLTRIVPLLCTLCVGGPKQPSGSRPTYQHPYVTSI